MVFVRLLTCALVLSAVGAGCSASSSASGPSGPAVDCNAPETLGLPGETSNTSWLCVDGKTYKIDCPSCKGTPFTCNCIVDDKPTGKSLTTSSVEMCIQPTKTEDIAAINSSCGWNIHP